MALLPTSLRHFSKLAVLGTLLLLLCGQVGPIPGFGPTFPMALPPPVIGTPQSLGTNTSASTNSLVLTTTANIVAGDLVVVCILGTTSISSVSDGTNSYSAVGADTTLSPSPNKANIYFASGASAVASGGSITVSYGGTGPSAVAAFRVPGILASGALDANASQSQGGANASTSTGGLAKANEIVTGCAGSITASAPSYTTSSGFTNVSEVTFNSNTESIADDFQIVSSTASVTYGPTWSPITNSVVILASFKGF